MIGQENKELNILITLSGFIDRKTRGNVIMNGKKIILGIIAVIFLLAAGTYTAGEWFRRRDYSEVLAAAKGSLVESKVLEKNIIGENTYKALEFVGSKGTRVSARIKIPSDYPRPLPAIIVLGGLRTGQNTIDYLQDHKALIILALDYPYRGPREDLGLIEFTLALPAMRRAVLETVPAVMLGMDYLLSRNDVDRERVVLAGGSLGALFVPAAMAADERIDAAAILFGAADIERLVSHDLDLPFPISRVAGWLCAVLVSPVEPVKYVGRISPRPLFILNGREDPRIPAECARVLNEKAGNPKTVKWVDGGHLNVRSKEFKNLVAGELLKWLAAEGFIVSEAGGGPGEPKTNLEPSYN